MCNCNNDVVFLFNKTSMNKSYMTFLLCDCGCIMHLECIAHTVESMTVSDPMNYGQDFD